MEHNKSEGNVVSRHHSEGYRQNEFTYVLQGVLRSRQEMCAMHPAVLTSWATYHAAMRAVRSAPFTHFINTRPFHFFFQTILPYLNKREEDAITPLPVPT